MHMDNLIQKTIFILREARAQFKNLAMLWSGGKEWELNLLTN